MSLVALPLLLSCPPTALGQLFRPLSHPFATLSLLFRYPFATLIYNIYRYNPLSQKKPYIFEKFLRKYLENKK